jgi:hypothetical protein
MIHDLADLLDLLESRRTGKDQKELLGLIREAAGEESCWFEFKVKQIQPTYSDVQEKKYRGGTTVIGELVDDRSEYTEEYVHDQSGQQIELLLPKWCNREVSRWKKGELFGCSGHLHGWDASDDRYQLLVTKVPFYSLGGKLLIWTLALLFFWWWWWPVWAIYKVVYVAIPVGLVVWAIAAFQGHEELARDVFMLLVILGPFGLFLRFYAYYVNRVLGNETGVEDQAEEES